MMNTETHLVAARRAQSEPLNLTPEEVELVAHFVRRYRAGEEPVWPGDSDLLIPGLSAVERAKIVGYVVELRGANCRAVRP